MVHAAVLSAPGGPENFVWQEVELGEPGAGEVRVRHKAVGLNYIDVYHRTGLYPLAGDGPLILGMEAAGEVVSVGSGVRALKPGDRVAYAANVPGAYAEERLIAADKLVPLPSWVNDRQAAAMMLQGMTAQYLLRSTWRVKADDVILVHAAAGGVGLILCQWAKSLGARVIGTVGSEAKAKLAAAHGCDHPLLYSDEGWPEKVWRLTDGKGCYVVYDSVGKATFMKSLDCLRPRGLMVSYGQASGPVEPIETGILAAKGSLYLTRPTLFHYTDTRENLMQAAADLFEVVHRGAVKINVNQSFPLKEVAAAHRALEARETTGSTVLLVD